MPEHLCQDNLFWRQSKERGRQRKASTQVPVCSGRLALWGRRTQAGLGVAGSQNSPLTPGFSLSKDVWDGDTGSGLNWPWLGGLSARQGKRAQCHQLALFFLSGAAYLEA